MTTSKTTKSHTHALSICQKIMQLQVLKNQAVSQHGDQMVNFLLQQSSEIQ